MLQSLFYSFTSPKLKKKIIANQNIKTLHQYIKKDIGKYLYSYGQLFIYQFKKIVQILDNS